MKNYLNFNFNANDSDYVSVYDELPLWSAPFGMLLLDTIKLKQNAKVLDIGCGTGFPLIELAGRFGNSSKIYGIDPWVQALKRINLKTEKYNIENVYLIKGTAEVMPFENDFFDLIVSNNGINNAEEPENVFSECFRICKKNGQFVFTMNLPGTMMEFYNLLEKVLRERNMLKEIEKTNQHIYEKRKPKNVLIEMVNKSGFSIMNIAEKSFYMRFANASAMFNYHFIKSHFIESWKNIIEVSLREEIFEELEKKLNDISDKQGFIELQIPYVCFDCNKT